MTQAEARQICQQLGVTFRKTDHGDYRVCYKYAGELLIYYTDDLDDAVQTARQMMNPLPDDKA